MSLDLETIYGLLPAVYRTRDAAIAGTLEGTLTPAEQQQLDALRTDPALDETGQRDLAALEDKRLRGPLKALLLIIAEQVAGLEDTIEQLYDDQFIETCAPWVVPYIADLVGYHPLEPRLTNVLGTRPAGGGQHHPIPAAQRHRGGPGGDGCRGHRMGRRRRGVLPATRDDPISQPHPARTSRQRRTCAA